MDFWKKRRLQGLLLVLPLVLLFVPFILYPTIHTIVRSFISNDGPIANYRVLFQTPGFHKAFWQTIWYAVLASVISVIVALPISLLIHGFIRRHAHICMLFSLPFSSGMIALAAIWMMLFNDAGGLFYKLLPMFGLTGANWLDNEVSAFLCVLLLFFWRNMAFILYSMIKALDSLPSITYESAQIAGATRIQSLRYISLPQILPSLVYVLPLTIATVLTAFEPFALLYSAGIETTSGAIYTLFNQILYAADPGISCAVCTLLILPVLLSCILYARTYLAHEDRW